MNGRNFHTILIALALLIGVGIGIGREWSEPIELTNARDERLDTEYDVAVDNHGNIHLLYDAQEGDGVLYAVFNSDGEPLREPVEPMGEADGSGTATMKLDEQNRAHIMCLAHFGEDQAPVLNFV